MLKNKYKFSYGSKIRKFINYIYLFVINFSFSICILLLAFTINVIFINNITSATAKSILAYIVWIVSLILFCFFITLTFLPKGIILNDSYMKIKMNAVNIRIVEPWFSTIIVYSSITNIEIFDNANAKKHKRFIRYSVYPVIFYDYERIVRITDKYGKYYYLSIENPEGFVGNIIEKSNILQDI